MSNIRDLLPGYCIQEQHLSLRDVVRQPLRLLHNRTPEEDRVHALSPTDDFEHPCLDHLDPLAVDKEAKLVRMSEEQIFNHAAREDYRGRPETAPDPQVVSPGTFRRNKQVTIRRGGGIS
jgi:hypothetical protein